jgi:hypothetical protein
MATHFSRPASHVVSVTAGPEREDRFPTPGLSAHCAMRPARAVMYHSIEPKPLKKATLDDPYHVPHTPRSRRRNGQPLRRPQANRSRRPRRRNHHRLLHLTTRSAPALASWSSSSARTSKRRSAKPSARALRSAFQSSTSSSRSTTFRRASAVPAGRTKPWGTTQAILLGCRARSTSPSPPSMPTISTAPRATASWPAILLPARRITPWSASFCATRSPTSDRWRAAFARLAEGYLLESIVELTKIERDGDGARNTDAAGKGDEAFRGRAGFDELCGDSRRASFDQLRERFEKFLEGNASDLKAECYIPNGGRTGSRPARRASRCCIRGFLVRRHLSRRPPARCREHSPLIADGLYPEKTLVMSGEPMPSRVRPSRRGNPIPVPRRSWGGIAPTGTATSTIPTSLLPWRQARPARYILQHINPQRLPQSRRVMQNIERVTAHLAAQAARRQPDGALRRVLKLVPRATGATGTWMRREKPGAPIPSSSVRAPTRQQRQPGRRSRQRWRVRPLSAAACQPAGAAPARYHPRFHHTPKRFAALEQAIAADVKGRAALASRRSILPWRANLSRRSA